MNLTEIEKGVYFDNDTIETYVQAFGDLLELHNKLRKAWIKTEVDVKYESFNEELFSDPNTCIAKLVEALVLEQSRGNKYVERIVREEISKDIEEFIQFASNEIAYFKSNCGGILNRAVFAPGKHLSTYNIFFNEEDGEFRIKDGVLENIEKDSFIIIDAKQQEKLDRVIKTMNEMFSLIIGTDGYDFFREGVLKGDFNVLQRLFHISGDKCRANDGLILRLSDRLGEIGRIKYK